MRNLHQPGWQEIHLSLESVDRLGGRGRHGPKSHDRVLLFHDRYRRDRDVATDLDAKLRLTLVDSRRRR